MEVLPRPHPLPSQPEQQDSLEVQRRLLPHPVPVACSVDRSPLRQLLPLLEASLELKRSLQLPLPSRPRQQPPEACSAPSLLRPPYPRHLRQQRRLAVVSSVVVVVLRPHLLLLQVDCSARRPPRPRLPLHPPRLLLHRQVSSATRHRPPPKLSRPPAAFSVLLHRRPLPQRRLRRQPRLRQLLPLPPQPLLVPPQPPPRLPATLSAPRQQDLLRNYHA